MTDQCSICNNDLKFTSLSSDAYAVDCPQCGKYGLTRPALVNLRNTDFTLRQRANISGWLRDNPGFFIKPDTIDDFFSIRAPRFKERADRLLYAMSKQSDFAGQVVRFSPQWIGYSWSINEEETESILEFLVETDRVKELAPQINQYIVKPKGWLRLDELEHSNADSSQGFVAMWFSEEMQPIYDGAFSSAIKNAGYLPHRVDQREHNNKIDDEIIAEIRKSRFVIADFTGLRGGVYYEAGFAKGLGIEVFWSCRDDFIKELHFDVRQYNCIVWKQDDLDDFARRLQFRIESVLGKGRYSPLRWNTPEVTGLL